MKPLSILEQAAEEAIEAAAWYNKECPGLGQDFASAIESALDLVSQGSLPLSPMPGALAGRGIKRLVLRRFPYSLVVLDRPDELVGNQPFRHEPVRVIISNHI